MNVYPPLPVYEWIDAHALVLAKGGMLVIWLVVALWCLTMTFRRKSSTRDMRDTTRDGK